MLILHSHNGLPFSTFDVDNDARDSGDFAQRSCARLYKVRYEPFPPHGIVYLSKYAFRGVGGMETVTILT